MDVTCMPLSRPAVKQQARDLIADKRRTVLITSLIFLVLMAFLGALSYQIIGYTPKELERYASYFYAGDLERAVEYLASLEPTTGESLVNTLLNMVTGILSLGYLIFLVHLVRGEEIVAANLLDGFGYWWKVILLDLLVGLIVSLWSMLFLVPGIIASYRYRMARYLLITHPELSITECMAASKAMTDGHKWELFVLDLSFLGWELLAVVPIVGWVLSIWIVPYVSTTSVLYYEHLSGADLPEDPMPL